MDWTSLIPTTAFLLHWALVLAVAVRVISKRRSQGVSLAWLAVLAWIPIAGVALYVLVGESWLSARRARRMRMLQTTAAAHFEALEPFAATEDTALRPFLAPLNRLARASSAIPTLTGNAVDLLDDADAFFPAIIEEISKAEHTIHLLFYIYHPGARTDDVSRALIDAAARGVRVRLLVDAVGSRPFLEGPWPNALRDAGVKIRVALPVRLARAWVARVDLRNHRKLAVFDSTTALTGSMNLADPAIFKRDAGVGPWVDIMARVRGPSAHALDVVFALDWCAEHPDAEFSAAVPQTPPPAGGSPVQIISSGPGDNPDDLRRVLLQSIYNAREELVVSTPYFVPDDTMMTALTTAAKRGVETTLIVPEKVDSRLVRHAARAYYDDLIHAGVSVRLFQGGLLHAKTAVIDRRLTLLGSANLDRRSLWINFELSIFIHDENIAEQMRYIQHRYIARSRCLAEGDWHERRFPARLLDNAAQLLAPIL
jgi:cardiolipin synthase